MSAAQPEPERYGAEDWGALHEFLTEEVGVAAADRAFLILASAHMPAHRTFERKKARLRFKELRAKYPGASLAWFARRLEVHRSTVARWNIIEIASREESKSGSGICNALSIQAGGVPAQAEPARTPKPITSMNRKKRLRRKKNASYRGAEPSSPHIGVSREAERRYRAYLRVNGRFLWRRLFHTEAEAAAAVREVRRKYIMEKAA